MPYGTVLADLHNDSLGNKLAPASAVFRNRIINGAMVIDQRNAGAIVTISSYALDRWQFILSTAGKVTAQQSSTAPTGFNNSTVLTSTSAYSVGASDYFRYSQFVEGYNSADLGWGTANAKTVTVSFWAYSSLTGSFGASIFNNGAVRSYPFSYSIPSANTWTYITVTIPGDTSGTWLTTNGLGLGLNFSMGAGSAYSGTANTWATAYYIQPTGSVNLVGTNGATFYITGVQLEVGSSATGFEYRQYGTELSLCQRYYEVFGNGGVVSSNAGNITAQQGGFKFQVAKRAAPTITHIANYSLFIPNTGSFTATTTNISNVSTTGGMLVIGLSSLPATVGTAMIYQTSTDNISASAEL